MKIDIITLFPEQVMAMLSDSIIGRAAENKVVEIYCHQLREYANNKHRKVDDYPYGGGFGMVMSAEPLAASLDAICGGEKVHTILTSPKGKVFHQEKAKELADMDRFVIICGHYEGVDQRFIDTYVDEEISIGDYVLTGGEIPAAAICDAVCRLVPGVLSEEECFTDESHWDGLLEYPQYTRPAVWKDKAVPEVLLSGHHKNIVEWQKEKSLEITKKQRPDLYRKYKRRNES